MVIKDYYKILGFENNKVNIDQIKNAYREQAKKYHPDVNNNNNKAEERFKDISEAYNTLSDTRQRRKYDRLWYYYIGRKKKQNKNYRNAKMKDFLGLFFGEKKQQEPKSKTDNKLPQRGEDINTEITATVVEAFFGASKQITFKTVGGGNKKIDIKIPAGIRNNEKIRVIGQGKPGKNNGKNGDLFIKIKIKDTQTLKLQGIDTETEITIPTGIQSGEQIVLKGKGYKDGKGGRGNLIAVVKIMIPKEISKEEILLFKKLKEISNFNPRNVRNV